MKQQDKGIFLGMLWNNKISIFFKKKY
jgi:hypothetical protein